jgi:hypothetical protein
MEEQKLEKYEEVVRAMLRHENDLVNHRIIWLTTVQGLLLTVLIFASGQPQYRPFVPIVPFLGAATSLMCWLLLDGSAKAMRRLRREANAHIKAFSAINMEYVTPGVVGNEPPFGGRFERLLGWSLLPTTFMVAWLAFAGLASQQPQLAIVPKDEAAMLETRRVSENAQTSGHPSVQKGHRPAR